MSDVQSSKLKSEGKIERRWLEFAVAITGSVLSIGLLTVLLAPLLTSVAAVEVVEDPHTFEIGTVAELEPSECWSVQPASRDGLLLKSPDRVLEVTLRPAVPDDQLEGPMLVPDPSERG